MRWVHTQRYKCRTLAAYRCTMRIFVMKWLQTCCAASNPMLSSNLALKSLGPGPPSLSPASPGFTDFITFISIKTEHCVPCKRSLRSNRQAPCSCPCSSNTAVRSVGNCTEQITRPVNTSSCPSCLIQEGGWISIPPQHLWAQSQLNTGWAGWFELRS